MMNRRKLISGAMAAAVVVFSASAVAAPTVDPLAGESWHAKAPSWPGTLRFDSKLKKVWLEPVGAEVMEASYSYTLKPAAKKSKVVEGTLRMINTEGQISESTFVIDGKELSLTFAGLYQAPERYVRMTGAEQEAEKARLMQMMKEGRVKPFTPR